MESYFQWNRLTAVALTAALLLMGSSALAAEKVVVLQPDSDTATEAEVNELAAALRADWEKRDEYSVLPTPKDSVLDLAFEAECIDTDDECFTIIGKSLGADLVVYATLEGENADIRVIDVGKGTQRAAFVVAGGAAGVAAAMAGSFGALPTPPAPKPEPKPAPKPAPKPVAEKAKPAPKVALDVVSNPPDAFVYLNNKRIGKTPLTTQQEPGEYTIRLLKPGFGDAVRSVTLSKAPVRMNINLVGEGENVVAAAPVMAQPSGPSDPNQEEFYETWWFWTAVGVAAVGVGFGIAAGAGAFSDDAPETGDLNILFGSGAEKDFRVQALRR